MLEPVLLAFERVARQSAPVLRRIVDLVPEWYVRRVSEIKLVRTLRYVYERSAFQRARWQEAGVTLTDITSPAVLSRLPFVTGKDLAAHVEDFFCVPRSELTEAMSSSGTTGPAKMIYMTPDDIERQTRMSAVHFCHFPGATRAMIMVFMRNNQWTAGAVNQRVFRSVGMHVVLSTSEMSIPDQVGLIKKHRANVLVGGPAYAHRFVYETTEDLRKLGVKYIHLGGQSWTEAFRREMEEAWGAKVIDGYASTESGYGLAGECVHQNGLHVNETDYWLEVIDPKTLQPLGDGEEGEVVFTTLSRRGMPLVRYRTGDIASLLPRGRRCACGLPARKMSRIRGRLDDMLIISTNNIYPDDIDRAILSLPGVSDYQLVIEKDTYKDVLNLTVECDDCPTDLRRTLIEALEKVPAVKMMHEIGKTVEYGRMAAVPRGELSRDRTKSVRIVDKRPGY